jgi:2-keto-4-pentenoate hydratase
MIVTDRIQTAARALREARASASPIPPISSSYGITTIDDAYVVAAVNAALRVDGGARVIGSADTVRTTARPRFSSWVISPCR